MKNNSQVSHNTKSAALTTQPQAAEPADMTPCRNPPVGWWCSRPSGHEGPCAACPDRGLVDSRCNYLGPTHGICNKCGRQHDARATPTAPTTGPSLSDVAQQSGSGFRTVTTPTEPTP